MENKIMGIETAEYEAMKNALIRANYQLKYVSDSTGNLALLLSIVVDKLSQSDDTSYYGSALKPIEMALLDLSGETYQSIEPKGFSLTE